MKRRCSQNICAFTKSLPAPGEEPHIRHAPHKFQKGPFALVWNQRERKLARLPVSQRGHLSFQIKGHLTGRPLYFNVHADDQRTDCFSAQQGLKKLGHQTFVCGDNVSSKNTAVVGIPKTWHSFSWFRCSGEDRNKECLKVCSQTARRGAGEVQLDSSKRRQGGSGREEDGGGLLF